MSQIATSLFSVASTTSVVISASVEHVGEYVDSSGLRYFRCLLPSAQERPLIAPHLFSLIRFTASNVIFFCRGVIRVESCGPKTGFPGIGPLSI